MKQGGKLSGFDEARVLDGAYTFLFLGGGGGRGGRMDILSKGWGGLGLWRAYVLDSGDVWL